MKPQGSRGHEIPNDLKTQWLVLYWKPHQWLSDTNWWYSKTTIFIQFLYFHPFSSYQKKQRRKNLSRRFSGSCTFSKITKTYSRLVLLRVTDFSYCRLRLNPHPNQPKIREPPRNFFCGFLKNLDWTFAKNKILAWHDFPCKACFFFSPFFSVFFWPRFLKARAFLKGLSNNPQRPGIGGKHFKFSF